MRPLMPEAAFPLWRGFESLLGAWPGTWPMFALVHVTRR
jgi:hypothetical protein